MTLQNIQKKAILKLNTEDVNMENIEHIENTRILN